MTKRLRRVMVATAGLATIVAACGDAGTETVLTDLTVAVDPGPAAPNSAIAEAVEVAVIAVDLFDGESAAVRAVLRGLEAGYSFAQIADGIRSGEMTHDGRVPGVDPARPSAGLIQGFRGAPSPISIDDAEQAAAALSGRGGPFSALLPSEAQLVGLVLAVASLGYTIEQVVAALSSGFERGRYAQVGRFDRACDAFGTYDPEFESDGEGEMYPDADAAECDRFLDRCQPFLVIAGAPVARPECPDPTEPLYSSAR